MIDSGYVFLLRVKYRPVTSFAFASSCPAVDMQRVNLDSQAFCLHETMRETQPVSLVCASFKLKTSFNSPCL